MTDGTDIANLPLIVQKVDFNLEENTREHRTNEFEIVRRDKEPVLVVRRGQPFTLKITFGRSYDDVNDAVCLVFVLKGLTFYGFLGRSALM